MGWFRVILGWFATELWDWGAVLFLVTALWGFGGIGIGAALAEPIPSAMEIAGAAALIGLGGLLLLFRIIHTAWKTAELTSVPQRVMATAIALALFISLAGLGSIYLSGKIPLLALDLSQQRPHAPPGPLTASPAVPAPYLGRLYPDLSNLSDERLNELTTHVIKDLQKCVNDWHDKDYMTQLVLHDKIIRLNRAPTKEEEAERERAMRAFAKSLRKSIQDEVIFAASLREEIYQRLSPDQKAGFKSEFKDGERISANLRSLDYGPQDLDSLFLNLRNWEILLKERMAH